MLITKSTEKDIWWSNILRYLDWSKTSGDHISISISALDAWTRHFLSGEHSKYISTFQGEFGAFFYFHCFQITPFLICFFLPHKKDSKFDIHFSGKTRPQEMPPHEVKSCILGLLCRSLGPVTHVQSGCEVLSFSTRVATQVRAETDLQPLKKESLRTTGGLQ